MNMDHQGGDRVDERTQVFMATALGAAVGGMVGWLYLTERGRRVRVQLEPFLDNIVDEIHQTQQVVDKARFAVNEGRRALDDVLRPSEAGASWESPDVGQTPQARPAR